jgi:hypothetical protein
MRREVDDEAFETAIEAPPELEPLKSPLPP